MKIIANEIFDHPACQKTGGLYLECGSNDGQSQSNTYRLELERGWKGILIDASQSALNKCQEVRSKENVFIHGAVSSPDKEGSMVVGDFGDGHLMSSIGGCRLRRPSNTAVKCITLGNVLKQYGMSNLDLLSLDVEGHEFAALQGMDFDFCMPKIMVVEVNGDPQPITDFLRSKGYDRAENISQFSRETNPQWDGTHQDWLFTKASDVWA